MVFRCVAEKRTRFIVQAKQRKKVVYWPNNQIIKSVQFLTFDSFVQQIVVMCLNNLLRIGTRSEHSGQSYKANHQQEEDHNHNYTKFEPQIHAMFQYQVSITYWSSFDRTISHIIYSTLQTLFSLFHRVDW